MASNGYEKYRNAYRRLVHYANRHGISVRSSDAGKAVGFEMPDSTVYVDGSLPLEQRYHSLRQKLGEMVFMRRSDPYWRAQRRMSSRYERRYSHYPQDVAGKLHQAV